MADPVGREPPEGQGGGTLLLILSWLWVGVPLVWGILETLRTSLALWQ